MNEHWVAIFDRSFTEREGGYIYYPSRWSRGYPVSAEEYSTARYLRTVSGGEGILLAIVLLMGMLLLAASFAREAQDKPWVLVVAVTVLIGTVGFTIWRGTWLVRRILGRDAVAPMRSKREWDEAIAAVTPWSWIGWPWLFFIPYLSLQLFVLPSPAFYESVLTALLVIALVICIYTVPGVVLAKLRQRKRAEDNDG